MSNQAWKSWIRAILMLVFMLPGMLLAAEGARPDVSFNHDQTRFKLTGFHTNVACESCHVKGVFKGTPTTCLGCHGQGGTALSTTAATKTTNHIPTTQDCSVCHKTDTFSSAVFSHVQLKETCATCHNGRTETGKPVTHIMTNQDCGVCHKTTAWAPAGYDHAGLTIGTGGCTTCHNGSTATGKPANHVRTTQQCDVCHKTFAAWIPAGYSHAASDTDCVSCHNGVNATSKTTTHIQTNQQCSVCHTQQAWLPANFDHSHLSGYPNLDCVSCHNGVSATAKTARHIPTTGYSNCDSCHTFAAWKPSIFNHGGVAAGTCGTCHIGAYTGATVKPAVHLPTGAQACDDCHRSTNAWIPTDFAHTTTQTAGKTCSQCHNGTVATARPSTHSQLILATGQCDVCHTTVKWKPTPMNHSGQTACSTCHSYNGGTWTSAPYGTAPYTGHINTGTRQCSDCHTVTTWAGPTFNHVGVSLSTNCATSCHDGVHATGRPTSGASAHTVAPMTNGTCGSCHAIGNNASTTFKTAPTMDHSGATACSSCHSFSVTKWTTNGGSPIFANHISTTTQCSSCHLSTASWAGAKVDHAAMTGATNCYTGCHDGTHGTGKPTSGSMAHMTSPMTNSTCGTCHANKGVSWLPRTMNGHAGATACNSCHSYTLSSSWTPTAPKAGHVVSTAQCSVCHKNFTSFAGARVDHTPFALSSDCRTSCHDGVHATASPTSGISSHSVAPMTSNSCGNCHVGKGVSWTTPLSLPSSMNNHTAATSCSNCHSYSVARWSKPGSPTYPGHITVTQQCSVCHNTSVWTGPTFNHAANGVTTASNCQTNCHDGSHATGKPASGVSAHTTAPMTDSTCGSCHQLGDNGNSFKSPAPTMNNHTGATACSSCHSYSVAKWSNPGSPTFATHLTTTAQCSTCHTSILTWAGAGFDHTGVAQGGDCYMGCHDGTHATGRPTTGISAHLASPMTANTCGNCHTIGSTSGITFKTNPTMNSHTAATSCSSCHSYSVPKWSNPGSPIYATHLTTTAQCSNCHSGFTVWSGAIFDHSAAGALTSGSNCASGCHDGTHATGAPTSGVSAHTVSPMTNTTCGTCHTIPTGVAATGSFKTSPTMNGHTGATACSSCHSYSLVKWSNPGSPIWPTHISTSLQCSSCHASTASWAVSAYNHSGVAQGQDCYTGCHDGSHATGRPSSGVSAHTVTPMTANTCGNCHVIGTSSSLTFKTTPTMNSHSGATSCASCHSYSVAKWSSPGSPTYANHIPIGSQQCSACHTSFASWVTSVYNHAGVTQSQDCFSNCHDGTHATGRPASGVSAHTVAPMTDATCGNCHVIGVSSGQTFRTTPGMNSHNGATACSACHSYTASKWSGPSPIYPNHIAIGTQQCSTCHVSFSTWVTAGYNHAGVTQTQNCFTNCHDGTHATGRPASGVSAHTVSPMTDNSCGNCHDIGVSGKNFKTTRTMNSHTGATACASCHSYTAVKWSNPGSPIYANHIAIGAQQCSVCHNSFSTWFTGGYNHAGVTQGQDCFTGCHNGSNATGRPVSGVSAHSVSPMTANNCGNCHVVGVSAGQTFKTNPTMNGHTGATACSSCHSYTVSKWSGPSPTYAQHIVTTAQCSNCHITTNWIGAFDHAGNGVTSSSDCYTGCHDGAHGTALGKTSTHVYSPMTSNACGTCHTSYSTFTGKGSGWTMNHTGATSCSNCHSYTSAGNGWTATGWNGLTPPVTGHPVTTAQCSSCHTTSAPYWKAAYHVGLTSASDCYTGCHDGGHSPALGPNASHSLASPMNAKTCGSCHGLTFTAFTFIGPMNHAGATLCSTCHTTYTAAVVRDGYTWNPIKVGHITTTSQCSSCHGTSSWTPANGFDHTSNGITASSNCYTGCHDGAHTGSGALGANPSHNLAAPMNSQFCGTCHAIGGSFHFTGPMNHTGAVACSTCHNTYNPAVTRDGYTWNPAFTTHITTTAQCSTCHTTNAWTPTNFNHTGITLSSDCYTGCHNGTNATGRPTGTLHTHVATTLQNVKCGVCHTIGSSWAPAHMDHTGTTSTCVTSGCHDNPTSAVSANGFTPAKTGHVPVSGAWGTGTPTCGLCHVTTLWKSINFAHTGVATGSCANCHQTGLVTAPPSSHPATQTVGTGATFKCDACHRTTAWLPATFAHTGVTNGCENCHKAGFAAVKSAAHFITTVTCEKCHTTTAWAPIKSYVHLSIYYKKHTAPNMTVYADCKLCHINNNEAISGAPHRGNAAYAKDCAWCHATQYKSGSHKKQEAVAPTTYYTVAELKDCAGSCHLYTNTSYTTIKTSRTGHHKSTDTGF